MNVVYSFTAMRDTAPPTLKCLKKGGMQSQLIVLDLLTGYLEPYAVLDVCTIRVVISFWAWLSPQSLFQTVTFGLLR